MTSRLLAVLLAALFLIPPLAGAREQTATFAVEKMTCFLCPFTVKRAMKKVPGVASVRIERRAGRAIVTFDDEVATVERIAKASSDAGYPAKPITRPVAP
ncbi:MAG: heavy-metal-associated domain-containing protein [Leptospirillia bacterium]